MKHLSTYKIVYMSKLHVKFKLIFHFFPYTCLYFLIKTSSTYRQYAIVNVQYITKNIYSFCYICVISVI